MSTNLINEFRRKIFGLIDSIRPASKYKAIILDRELKAVFDRVIDEHEILDRDVASVQVLDDKRQAETYLEAVYFIKPTKYNVECIAADFTRVPSRYSCAHLFVTPGLTNELSLKIKNSSIGKFLKNIEVVNIDFLTLESQVFSLNERFAIEEFYNSQCHDLVIKQADRVAAQLVGICTMLNEYPIIRFYRANDNCFKYEANSLPFLIADKFQRQLDDYIRNHIEFTGVSEQRGRSVFLILDRSIDPFAPLLHEFTFQAMAYDLLPIEDGGKIRYQIDGDTGKKDTEGVISEKDPDWVGLRHLHMQEVIEQLTAKMDRLKKDNPHFAQSVGAGSGGNASLSDIQDMIASLPEFMETRERFALNLHMASECMAILQRNRLNEIADIEQTVVLGVGADGRKSKTITDEFIAILADKSLTKAEKIRLIMIYAIHRGGLIEADFKKLMIHSGLDEYDISVIRNMRYFGHPTVKEGLGKQQKNKSKYYFTHSTEDVFSTSRFVPGIKNIVEDTINGTLNSTDFPYTKEPTETNQAELENHSSLRNPRQRAVWARSTANQPNKQRVFVYMAGGFTQSEARSVYELNKKYPKEVIIGGDKIVTPNEFLQTLSRLEVPRGQLKLPCDEHTKSVPQYLYESDRQNRPTPSPSPSQQSTSTKTAAPTTTTTSRLAERPTMKEKKSSRFGKFFK